jgi:hypothetical protein
MSRPVLAVAAALLLSSCHIEDGAAGEPVIEKRSVDAGKVEMVRVDLSLGAGELKLTGGGDELMEGEFQYDPRSQKPVIRYETTGFRGRLNVQSGAQTPFGPKHGDKWTVQLGREIPMDLHVRLGAGEGDLKLAGLKPRSVSIEVGAGELDLDLRDRWEKDFNVEIRGGVGEATVRLPRDVGVSAVARGGIGDIKVTGLTKRGSQWVNDQFEKAKTTIRVDVRGGVGQINLIGE